MTTSDNNDEWEYEYDDQETEDFYITLDLTTHVPPSATHDKKAKAPKTGRGSNKSLANAPGTNHQLVTHQSPAPQQEDHESPQPQSQSQPPPTDRMQIVDLHGDNPLVSHNNTLYSCRWATDVGTSLFLVPPMENVDSDHPPVRSTPSFDLLGTASARLMAIPATVQPRTAPLHPASPRPHFPDQHSYATYHGDVVHQSETEGIHIALPSTASASRVSQARFLERLSAIKARRGDKDHVPVTNIKIYKPPEGWEAERDEWIARETSLSEKNRLEAELRAAKLASRNNSNKAPVDVDEMPSPRIAQGDALSETPYDLGEEELSEQDLDAPDPNRIVLASQVPRKRRTRGGPRGGAPSGKKLRQSLGLPESRRDKRAVGRPRQINLDSNTAGGADEGGPSSASSHQGSVEPSAAGSRHVTQEPS